MKHPEPTLREQLSKLKTRNLVVDGMYTDHSYLLSADMIEQILNAVSKRDEYVLGDTLSPEDIDDRFVSRETAIKVDAQFEIVEKQRQRAKQSLE